MATFGFAVALPGPAFAAAFALGSFEGAARFVAAGFDAAPFIGGDFFAGAFFAGPFVAGAFFAGAFFAAADVLRDAGALAAFGDPALRGRARVSDVAKWERPLREHGATSGADKV
ncbi:hypothetical protein [Dokdonella sp.]|uniref:hypothetical protein n=1 Tax=Dokdonella sp. TaxID=2291710 RepID=UPI002F429CC6